MNTLRILLFCAIAASSLRADDPIEPPVDVKKDVGEQTVGILRGATRVQAFSIHEPPLPPGLSAPATAPAEKFGGYYIIDGIGREQGKEFAARLSAVLLAARTYDQSYTLCFSPGVAYRFWKDRESVDVLICFTCSHVRIGGKMLNLSKERGAPALQKLVDESFAKDAKGEKTTP